MTLLIGCAPLSDVKERDVRIALFEEYQIMSEKQMYGDSLKIDSLESETEHLKTEHQNSVNMSKMISDRRDHWFFRFTSCQRDIDTLYVVQSELYYKVEQLEKKCR